MGVENGTHHGYIARNGQAVYRMKTGSGRLAACENHRLNIHVTRGIEMKKDVQYAKVAGPLG